MSFEALNWLSRAIVGAVVLSTLWLANITDNTERRPRLVAGVSAEVQPSAQKP